MTYPLVRELAAEGKSVAVACRVLKLCRQAFYRWAKDPVTARDWDDAHLINQALSIHADDPGFGYRFITDELNDHREAAAKVSKNRVHRLCQIKGIQAFHSRKRGVYRPPGNPAHDDLVKRVFTTDTPNRLWLTDITEHPTREGKLYLCAVKDQHSNRIVGYAIDSHMKASLAVRALRSAIHTRKPDQGLVVHSDRGSQFRAQKYLEILRAHQISGSMGKTGSSPDNAAMESFFALLQKNVLNRQRLWNSRAELKAAIVHWIEAAYHRRRRQKRLGGLTPIEYETINNQNAELAA